MATATPLTPLDDIRCKLDADHMKTERYWRVRSIVCCVLAGVLFLMFCAVAFSVSSGQYRRGDDAAAAAAPYPQREDAAPRFTAQQLPAGG